MKSGKSWWMPVLLGVLLMAILVGVAGARPNEKAQAASGTRQLIIGAADFYPINNTYAFYNDGYYLHASNRVSYFPTSESYYVGFRVSEVPEPGTMAILALGGVGLLRRQRSVRS